MATVVNRRHIAYGRHVTILTSFNEAVPTADVI
jgi:hypothetical protein